MSTTSSVATTRDRIALGMAGIAMRADTTTIIVIACATAATDTASAGRVDATRVTIAATAAMVRDGDGSRGRLV